MNEPDFQTVTNRCPDERLVRTIRWRAALGALVLIPLGFGTKYYSGPGADWANNSAAGGLYEIFWCLVIQASWPRICPKRVAAGVLLATCGLEFLQLWHPAWLEALRSHFLGRAILGSTFSWSDFPYYFAGCGAGWWLMRRIMRAS